MQSLFTGLSALALLAAAPLSDTAPAAPQITANAGKVGIAYRGYLIGIPVLKSTVNVSFADAAYKANAEFKTAGLAAVIKQVKVIARTDGERDGVNLSTTKYWHQELDGHKNRQLFMDYTTQAVKVRFAPPIRHMGDPPANPAQMREAADPVSGILEIALRAGQQAQGQQCAGAIKVFDGKQRYDLFLTNKGIEPVRTKAYKGKAIKCEIRYRPVAGFNADDLEKAKKDYQRPINMWLAETKTSGMRLPVRFSYHLPFGAAVVEARQISID